MQRLTADLHERDEELAGGVTDGLLAVAEALDGGGHEGIEVDLEVVAGEHGGGGERVQAALRDPEVGVPGEIHAGVDERRDLSRREPAPRRGLQGLVQPLHPGQALLGVLGARRLQRRLHFRQRRRLLLRRRLAAVGFGFPGEFGEWQGGQADGGEGSWSDLGKGGRREKSVRVRRGRE